jgi:hypothetical protein
MDLSVWEGDVTVYPADRSVRTARVFDGQPAIFADLPVGRCLIQVEDQGVIKARRRVLVASGRTVVWSPWIHVAPQRLVEVPAEEARKMLQQDRDSALSDTVKHLMPRPVRIRGDTAGARRPVP